jgi:hypothetical protein
MSILTRLLFQLHKTIAKLKLLQRGLIREAQRIDDFNIRAKKSKNADEDEIADVLEEEQEGSETAEEFMERIGDLSNSYQYYLVQLSAY